MGLLVPQGALPIAAAGRNMFVERPASTERFEPAVRLGKVTKGDPGHAAAVLDAFALEVIRLTNEERRAAGVAPVKLHPKVMAAADIHARDIASKSCKVGVLSHTGSDGSNAGDRIVRSGLSISRWSENIACAHGTPESVVQGWMRSSGHRKNLLDPRHSVIGVAVERDERGILYWVQNFAAT